MVDKGDDPGDILMKEGIFRIFKDGDDLAKNTTWNYSDTRSVSSYNINDYTIYSAVK